MIGMAIECLKVCLQQPGDENEESNGVRKISFIVEQLDLLRKRKFGRQYSPQFTILSYMIHAASSAAYTALRDEDVLCLPSTSSKHSAKDHKTSERGPRLRQLGVLDSASV